MIVDIKNYLDWVYSFGMQSLRHKLFVVEGDSSDVVMNNLAHSGPEEASRIAPWMKDSMTLSSVQQSPYPTP